MPDSHKEQQKDLMYLSLEEVVISNSEEKENQVSKEPIFLTKMFFVALTVEINMYRKMGLNMGNKDIDAETKSVKLAS